MTLTERIRKLEAQIIKLRRRVFVLEARRTGPPIIPHTAPPISVWLCSECGESLSPACACYRAKWRKT